ncbi:hypothetical protein Q7O44_08680 [Shigella flexneri]|nr:hypothetical protein [Shigella flexneri]
MIAGRGAAARLFLSSSKWRREFLTAIALSSTMNKISAREEAMLGWVVPVALFPVSEMLSALEKRSRLARAKPFFNTGRMMCDALLEADSGEGVSSSCRYSHRRRIKPPVAKLFLSRAIEQMMACRETGDRSDRGFLELEWPE